MIKVSTMHGKSEIEAVPCIVQALPVITYYFNRPPASDPDRQQASPHTERYIHMKTEELKESLIDYCGKTGANFVLRIIGLLQAETPGVELLESVVDLIESDDRQALEHLQAFIDQL